MRYLKDGSKSTGSWKFGRAGSGLGTIARAMTTVETHAVGRRYGQLVAVSDLTFALEAGDVLGVLGPNGAGKTTAIRVLTAILAPSWGSFEVAGAPHTRPDEIRRGIGVLPES